MQKATNKGLVIAPCGDDSIHPQWLSKGQDFDLVLLYYGQSDAVQEAYARSARACLRYHDEKWPMVYRLLMDCPHLLEEYDYFWFPDDDMATDAAQISKLFAINRKYDLWLSQPSMDGYFSHAITQKVEGSLLRYTNFVEIGIPMMSRATLRRLLPTFATVRSGWGLDFLWPKKLGYPMDKIAIIDAITVTHTRPIGSGYDRFPKSPHQEMSELFALHNLVDLKQTLWSVPL